MFNNYQSYKKKSKEEILEEHPEIAEQLAQQNAWAQYEGKPDLSNVSEEEMRLLSYKARNGEEDNRIDSFWLTL